MIKLWVKTGISFVVPIEMYQSSLKSAAISNLNSLSIDLESDLPVLKFILMFFVEHC